MIVVENAKLFSYEKAEKVANAGTKGSHIRNIIKFSGSTVKIASQVKIADCTAQIMGLWIDSIAVSLFIGK